MTSHLRRSKATRPTQQLRGQGRVTRGSTMSKIDWAGHRPYIRFCTAAWPSLEGVQQSGLDQPQV